MKSIRKVVKVWFVSAAVAAVAAAPASIATAQERGARDGSTDLHRATLANDALAVERLIRAGADVNAATRYGVTPIALAALNGSAGIIALLVKAGANVNATQSGGETVLMTAARTGQPEAVRLLLDHGADPNAVEGTRGQTALMWAADEGNTAAVQALLKGGAQLSARSRSPEDAQALSLFVSAGQKARVKPRVDAFTPFMFAVRSGHIDTVAALLEAGALPTETLEDGTSALMVAIVNAHWELAAFLLDRGADPREASKGWTPLHQLIRTRNPSIGQTAGPTPTGRITSLDLARKLIERGADVNARMTKDMNDGQRTRLVWPGSTPLLLAAKSADSAMMRLLAEKGADPKLKNAIGSTPLMVASGLAMYHVSEDSGTDEQALEAVKVALAIGAGDVNDTDDEGDTALHGAARRNSSAIAQLLIANGAKLEVANKVGATPLMIANGFTVINAQRQPETIALLSRTMTERGLDPVAWPPGAPSAHRMEFETDAKTAAAILRRNVNLGAVSSEAVVPAKEDPKKPENENE